MKDVNDMSADEFEQHCESTKTKDVNDMSADEFDQYIQSQGFATAQKIAEPEKDHDMQQDLSDRDDLDGFGPGYDKAEKDALQKMASKKPWFEQTAAREDLTDDHER